MSISTHQQLDCDVLVAGGGMSGVCAALAAARRGAQVILCQDRPVLGGNASSEIRMHIVGADMSGRRGAELANEAREGGIIEEIRLENCVRNPQRSPSMFDLILYDKCRAEPNLNLLLNTTVTGVKMRGNRITSIDAERPSTEESFTISAIVFVDATGDGRMAVEAGAPYLEGRESHEQFGESLAQPVTDNQRLGSSIMFQARRHDRPIPFVPPSWARKFTEDDLRLRPHVTSGGHGDLNLEYGYWWVEWGGHLDTIKQNEQIRDELLAIVLGVWDHVKNGGDHGADNWALEWFGFVPGKRESRRFIGQYTLTERDVLESKPHDDAIAYGGWFIDTHPALGVDAPEEPPCTQHDVPLLYDIPLRSCVSSTIENLMFAGRNISATHIAFASTRVMATCAAVGQGIGTAAAHAAAHRILPIALAENSATMAEIQQQLLEDDAFLIGRERNKTCDFASRATISASSEQACGLASNVLAGPTRSMHGERGAPLDRVTVGTHRWMSDPAKGLPAWIQLEWPAPILATSVQLIFDTAMHRVLTMSLADAYTRMMHWGRPQEETVSDYFVEIRSEGKWQRVASVKENYQRRNLIPLNEQVIDSLKITIESTGGIDHARICEIRVW